MRSSARQTHWANRQRPDCQDNTLRIWRVFPTVAALDEHAHAIMPHELTSTQRKQFFLD
jgi:hypothetical protein